MADFGLGTWFLDQSAWPAIETGRGKRIVDHAWDRGVRHFDTAESYGNGRAEQLLGQALRSHLRAHREQAHIATKSVVRPAASLRAHLERSLRRLNVEWVDTFYIHWPREGLDLAAAVEELARNRERGLLRRIGLCNVTPTQVQDAQRGAAVDTVQFGYNTIWRAPEAQGLVALPQRRVSYSTLAQGLLARAFSSSPDWDASDHRRRTPLFSPPVWPAVHRYQQLFVNSCRDKGFSPAAVAVLWALDRVDEVLVGTRSVSQLDDLLDGIHSARDRPGELHELMEAVTAASSRVQQELPELPNMFGYVPTPCRSC